ncbi:MAG: hypothetical protein FJW99_05505 [Actinobacteria bacterium]|nr:hypothetical protein [Actinomycetota bacterium]MBM3696903.1 hypothetical protein [Actinomycetota bacterium]
MRTRLFAPVVAGLAGLALLAAGCGSTSDTTDTATPTREASGVGSASGMFDPGIEDALATAPPVPACRPDTSKGSASRTRGKDEGGYNDDWTNTSPDDEEICGHFYNYMVTWSKKPAAADAQAVSEFAAQGPSLGTGATQWISEDPLQAVGGAWTDGNGQWMWGPSCGNLERGQKDGYDYRYCNKPEYGWGFGQNVEITYWDQNFTSNAAFAYMKQKAGDVSFGPLYFRMYNNGGESDGKPGNCDDSKSNARTLLSCAAMDQGKITDATENANDPDYDRLAFGFYVQNYPVAIRVANDLPDSRLDIRSVNTGTARVSAQSSTLGNGTSVTSGQSPDALWWAGYRAREGSTITITGKLVSTATPPAQEPWVNQTVTITSRFPAPPNPQPGDKTVTERSESSNGATCRINQSQTSGEAAQCNVTNFVNGSPSRPGVADIVISR